MSYFRIFGCLTYVLMCKKDQKVLQSHTRRCIFTGYPERTKAWKFWNPAAKKVIILSHAVFDESCFPSNLPFINVCGLPLNDVDIPEASEDASSGPPPPRNVPDLPELSDQEGDDDYDDPAPPAVEAPPPPHSSSPSAPDFAPQPLPPPPAPVPCSHTPIAHQPAHGQGGFRPYPALA